MSYNADLQNNNTSLQEILATVNSLPEAGGSSGGGAEIETCDVQLNLMVNEMVCYLALENGEIVVKNPSENFATLTNVVVGSFLVCCFTTNPSYTFQATPPTYSYSFDIDNRYLVYIYQIPSGGITIISSAF